jgi:hypothetical protein
VIVDIFEAQEERENQDRERRGDKTGLDRQADKLCQ